MRKVMISAIALFGFATAASAQVPENTMKFYDFMASVGSVEAKAESWKDYFFPEVHDLKGS